MQESDIFMKKVYAKAVELGGLISGEHGIGITKLEFLTDEDLQPFWDYKKQVDPKHTFNRHKLMKGSDLRNAYTPSFELLGAESLINQGHRALYGVFKRDDVQGMERYRGFMDRVTESGMSVPDSHVLWYDTETRDQLFKAGESALFLRQVMDSQGAVLCYNDSIAMLLCDMIRTQGGKVPRDVSVMGFDDCAYAPLFHPRLTTLSHPKEEFGRLAAVKLLEMVNGKPAASSILDWTLVQRNSVAEKR